MFIPHISSFGNAICSCFHRGTKAMVKRSRSVFLEFCSPSRAFAVRCCNDIMLNRIVGKPSHHLPTISEVFNQQYLLTLPYNLILLIFQALNHFCPSIMSFIFRIGDGATLPCCRLPLSIVCHSYFCNRDKWPSVPHDGTSMGCT